MGIEVLLQCEIEITEENIFNPEYKIINKITSNTSLLIALRSMLLFCFVFGIN